MWETSTLVAQTSLCSFFPRCHFVRHEKKKERSWGDPSRFNPQNLPTHSRALSNGVLWSTTVRRTARLAAIRRRQQERLRLYPQFPLGLPGFLKTLSQHSICCAPLPGKYNASSTLPPTLRRFTRYLSTLSPFGSWGESEAPRSYCQVTWQPARFPPLTGCCRSGLTFPGQPRGT